LNAGLVVKLSSAAVNTFAASASACITHSADSWLPNLALIECCKNDAFELIGDRGVV
jgi:hypothetical protein